jgi:glutaredoxin 3
MTGALPKVVVFTTPTCSYCTKVKSYLRSQKVPFKEVDISKNDSAAKDMKRMTGQMGVPVVMIKNRPIVGFDKAKIDRALGLKSSHPG